MNRLTYPLTTMRITQGYTGNTSHLPHTTGIPKDYPIDDGEKDTGRGAFYCPCDGVVVKRIYGVGNKGVNTIWLESANIVGFADGTSDFVTILITHPNDDDLRKLRVGQTFKRGDYILREGTDGASGNHFHLSAGKGKIKGNGWTKNSYSKYVLTTTHGTYKPEQLFFIDPKLTNVVNSKGLCFKTLLSNPYIFNEPKKYITKGDKGISVQWVQYELVRLCYNIGGGIDGRCGPITTEAIRKFQKNHGLVADGKAGPLTRGAMTNA